MTKLRAPASFEQAITRIAALLGWGEAARIVDRGERTVRDWSDPDSQAAPTIDQAFALDLAYRAAGGAELPFHQVYGLRLELEAAAIVDQERLCSDVAIAAREVGEAISALVTASARNANPADRARAMQEGQEALEALTRAMADLAVPPGTLAR